MPDDDNEPEQFVDSEEDGDSEEDDALMSRLRVIEDQPLESRAPAFAQVHDELQSRLEGQ